MRLIKRFFGYAALGAAFTAVVFLPTSLSAGCGGVRTICTPQAPECTEECIYVTEFPTCRTKCVSLPPICEDIVEPDCVVKTLPDFGGALALPRDEKADPCALILHSEDVTCEVVDGVPVLVPVSEDDDRVELEAAVSACARVTPAVGYTCIDENGVVRIVPIVPPEEDERSGGLGPCSWVYPAPGFVCQVVNGQAVLVPMVEPEKDNEPEVGICGYIFVEDMEICVEDRGFTYLESRDGNFEMPPEFDGCFSTGEPGVISCAPSGDGPFIGLVSP